MLRNYFYTALRSIFRRKLLSLTNLLGLAVGISSFLVSYHHYMYENSYDRQYEKADALYRIVTGDVVSGEGWVRISAPLPIKIKQDVPEVTEVCRLINLDKNSKTSVKFGTQIFYEKDFFLADPTVVDFFDLDILQGNHSAIDDPKSMIISQAKARQLFGYQNPIGQTIRVNDQHEFTVEGVYKDFPENTHLNLDFIVSFQNLETLLPGTSLTGNWGQFNYFGYALLHPDADVEMAREKIKNLEVRLSDENTFQLEQIGLQPLRDIHFQENRGNLKASTNIKNLWIYALAAIAILMISIINYVNLSVASSTRRLREVGLRKTIGAFRGQLILQFIGESVLMVALATLAALVCTHFFFIELINNIFGLDLSIAWSEPITWLLILGLTFFIGLLSGSYIAYYIVRIEPVKALRGGIKMSSGRQPVRNFLLATQFLITITLLSAILTIRAQMSYLQDQDIGMNKEGVVSIPIYDDDWRTNIQVIKEQLMSLPEVEVASGTGFQPGIANWHQTVWWEGQQEDASMNIISADQDFIAALDLELVEGNLDLLDGDQNQVAYILNQSALQLMGWSEASGKLFSPFGTNRRKAILGVVNDFNYKSLHHPIEPCVIVLGNRFAPDQLLVKITSSNISTALEKIKEKLVAMTPNIAFQYDFLTDRFKGLYQEEYRSQKLISLYTTIAIFLSVLGLFALITFEVNERTKEIAIRKVLGISEISLGILISSRFIRIVALVCIVALPLTLYLMQNWLANFNYRIALRLDLFLWSMAIILLMIVGTGVIKVIQLNKVNTAQVLKQY